MNLSDTGTVTDEGQMMIRVANVEVILRASGAMWLAHERMLVVADLHLEKGSAYAVRGQLLPPYDTRETLDRLEREVDALAPRTLVLLGDTLHDNEAEDRLAPDAIARIRSLSERLNLVWVCGNHDPDGANNLGGETTEVIEVSGLVLRHTPSSPPVSGEVAGHLHPCACLRGTAGRVRRRCFASDGHNLILPAFGAYAGGLNVRDAAFTPVFKSPPVSYTLGRRVTPLAYGHLKSDPASVAASPLPRSSNR